MESNNTQQKDNHKQENQKEQEKPQQEQEVSAFQQSEQPNEEDAQHNNQLESSEQAEEGEHEQEDEEAEEDGEDDFEDIDSSDNDQEEVKEPGSLGCEHYFRGCQLMCPDQRCHGKFFTCRLCHDKIHYEAEMDPKKNHQLVRFEVKRVKCLRCQEEQPVQKTCEKCQVDFSKYFCSVCNLFDDKAEQKGIFHCEQCGICRVGGRDNYFHCNSCGCCLSIMMRDSHACVQNRTKQDCVICLDDIHSSRKGANFLPCGHTMHTNCFRDYIKNSYACPVCRKSIVDMKSQEPYIDSQLAAIPMPAEYANVTMQIQCNDCQAKSTVKFHIMGGKCSECRSYNTGRLTVDNLPEDAQQNQNQDQCDQQQQQHESTNNNADQNEDDWEDQPDEDAKH